MRIEAMDYDSITGRMAMWAAGMVAAAGPRPDAGQAERRGTPARGSQRTFTAHRSLAGRDGHKAIMANGRDRVPGLDAAQQTVGRVDARTRGVSGPSFERLASVKPQDFWWLFVMTAIVWAAVFGAYLVLELMKVGAL